MVKDHKSCGKGKDKTGKARLKILGAGSKRRGFRVVQDSLWEGDDGNQDLKQKEMWALSERPIKGHFIKDAKRIPTRLHQTPEAKPATLKVREPVPF